MALKHETVAVRLNEIGYRVRPKEGDYGIEIETETKKETDYPKEFFVPSQTIPGRFSTPLVGWEAHIDNSLRNFGREFVFAKPATFDQSMVLLDEFEKKTKDVKFIKHAPATSIHVHVNMLNDTPLALANFLALYLLFENVLVDYSGESRRSNLFALPTRVATWSFKNYKELIKLFLNIEGSNFTYDQSYVKYAALNVGPIVTFGSVEIRSFRGETDVNEIKNWLKIINKIREYSRRSNMNPLIMLTRYRIKGIEFFNEVFEEMAEIIESKTNEISFLIEKNRWFLYSIARLTDDWGMINTVKKKEKKSKTVQETSSILEHLTHFSLTDFPQPVFGNTDHVNISNVIIEDDFENEEDPD